MTRALNNQSKSQIDQDRRELKNDGVLLAVVSHSTQINPLFQSKISYESSLKTEILFFPLC